MASMSLITSYPWLMNPSRTQIPSASLSRLSGSKTRSSVSVNAAFRPAAFHCSFLSSSSSFSSLSSSFSGLSMGSNFSSESRIRQKRGTALVVRAGKKGVLAMTKRNKSRKSLARVHGFRRRMRTTSGRAILKRRRAKGRWVLCTKTNPNRGK